ncbi:MAG: hypothetical protein WBO55_00795 [Rhizobiaceae bacterium]
MMRDRDLMMLILTANRIKASMDNQDAASGRQLLARRDSVRKLLEGFRAYVEQRSTGALRKSLGLAAAACVLLAGVDAIHAWSAGRAPLLAPAHAISITMTGGLLLAGCLAHGHLVLKRLMPISIALRRVAAAMRTVELEIDRRLAGKVTS